MKTAISTNINEQTSPNANDQLAPNANGKRSLGLKIRTRVGMEVRTNLKTGSGNGSKGTGAACSIGGCTGGCGTTTQ